MERKPCPPSCVDCAVAACRRNQEDRYPEFCLTKNMDPEILAETQALYQEPENNRITRMSAKVEAEHYCQMTRVEEIMERAAFQLLALVGNLGEVSWTYTDVTGETHTSTATEADYLSLLRDPLPELDGTAFSRELDILDSLKDYTDTAAHFQRFCRFLDAQCYFRRVYEQSPELLPAP